MVVKSQNLLNNNLRAATFISSLNMKVTGKKKFKLNTSSIEGEIDFSFITDPCEFPKNIWPLDECLSVLVCRLAFTQKLDILS